MGAAARISAPRCRLGTTAASPAPRPGFPRQTGVAGTYPNSCTVPGAFPRFPAALPSSCPQGWGPTAHPAAGAIERPPTPEPRCPFPHQHRCLSFPPRAQLRPSQGHRGEALLPSTTSSPPPQMPRFPLPAPQLGSGLRRWLGEGFFPRCNFSLLHKVCSERRLEASHPPLGCRGGGNARRLQMEVQALGEKRPLQIPAR